MRTPHHNNIYRALMVALVLMLSGLLTSLAPAAATATTGPAEASTYAARTSLIPALDFRNAMRRLWEDHIGWTRLYIVSVLADLPDKELVAGRLLHNQDDIGAAISPFYGEAAGTRLTELLREHILGADELLAAAKAGDNAGIEAGKVRWYRNADDIATFLNAANPKAWSHELIASTMKMHLDLTLEEAVARLTGDWAADVAAYNKIHEHILGMADVLSAGIIAQFPDRFSAAPPAQEMKLRNEMREAWEDHIIWTRLLIVSAISDLPDKEAALNRLMQDQVDIGNLVKPYYGDAAGEQLTVLLKEHITGAVDLVTAAVSNNSAAVETASARWYANGDSIATFLNSANPGAWPLDALKAMMKEHLDLTLEEAVAHLKGDYTKDIADYNRVHDHILGMADALSTGIIAQFPERFDLSAGSTTTGAMPGGEHIPEHAGMPRTGEPTGGTYHLNWELAFAGLLLTGAGWLVLKRVRRQR